MIRPMETRDVNKVVTLAKEMHQEGDYKDIPFHTDVFVSTISHCMRDGFAWVGEKDGKIVAGFLASINNYMFSKAKMTNDYGVFTSKEYRKTRLALQLLKKYIEWAKEQDVHEICIGISNSSETNGLDKFLQKRLGFHQAGRTYKLRNKYV
jgi:L-amino acid N-acyltransferase YncA